MVKRTVLALLLATGLAGAAGATSWETGAFRTASGGLVHPGDTMVEVLQSAGEPLARRVISKGIALGGLVGLTHELWTYRGSDGIYLITFAGHKVARIEVVPDR